MATASIHWIPMDPNWATASDRENGKGAPDRRYYNVGQQPATSSSLRAPATGNGCRGTAPCWASKGVIDLQTAT